MDVRKLYFRMKLHKVPDSVVYKQALVYKHVSKTYPQCELVQGYVLSGTEACWHCWVQHEDTVYDFMSFVFSTPLEYTLEIPEGVEHMEHENIDTNKKLYDLFKNNVKEFWNTAPKQVREFKV